MLRGFLLFPLTFEEAAVAKIRGGLVGAVHVGGHVLFAGDAVPRGVAVGAHVLAEEKPKRGRPKKDPDPDEGAVDAAVD